MKISKAEGAAILLAGGFVLFFAGWFFQGSVPRADTYVISAQHQDAGGASPTPEVFVPDRLVDLNSATQADLEALPGIGAVRAAAILAYREANGPFTRPEQLTQVEGIGQSTYEALAQYITVTPAEGGSAP